MDQICDRLPAMKTIRKRDPALLEAIHRAGSKAKLARALGGSRAAITLWTRVPIGHVERVSALYRIAKRRLLEPHIS